MASLETEHTQPRATIALKRRGTCVPYTPSTSGELSWVMSSLRGRGGEGRGGEGKGGEGGESRRRKGSRVCAH